MSGEGPNANPGAQYWNQLKGALVKERVKMYQLQHLNHIFMDAEIETIVTTVCPNITPNMMKSPRFLPLDVKQFIGLKLGDMH